ncbi:MAG: P1 family peptidase, partial [Clostridia bacterium]|nr:P1 family peptidase [Clostridia bacterium]
MKQKRISDYGIHVGRLPAGERNRITDVPGVLVGHSTIKDERHNTGVTVILPAEGNIFRDKLTAAVHVHNGFGKTMGTVQIEELGTLETPIALTNTLNVGKVADGITEY